jgi:penicillin-binding protein 1C
MALTQVERVLLERRLQQLNKRSHTARIVILVLATAFVAPLVLAVTLAGSLYVALADELAQGLAQLQDLDKRTTFQTTLIRDRNGTVLREVAPLGKRTQLALADIPLWVRQATIAVEDKTFYTNPGVDPIAIARMAGRSAMAGGFTAGGASTITQQFVRAVAFSYEERIARSPTRKLKEIILSFILAKKYSKDQVLEWYLNEIYYGNQAYGIEAAAQVVFGKPAQELTLAEAALLAGLPQLPATYDPLDPDPDVQELVHNRQATVLDLMAENGFISAAEAEAAKAEPPAYAAKRTDEGLFLAPHFVVWVQKQLEELVGPERIAQGGLEVTTSLDLDLQDRAQQIVTDQVEKNRQRHDMTNGALVSMEPRTGQVLAMVGSVDYFNKENDGNVNVAVRERQPGSSIKPLTYVTAFENGITPAQLIWDVKMVLYIPQKFEPKNYDERFHGPVRLREALANSYNIPALKLLASIAPTRAEDAGKTGVEMTIDTAHRMGITGLNRDPGEYGLSLTLGGGEVTLLDLTTAYATLANEGGMVKPHPILKVTDSSGKTLYDLAEEPDALKPTPAVSAGSAFLISDILSDNAARTPAFGGRSPLYLGVPAAVKTGTTNDYRDNWTVGYTPYLTTGVWAGNNDNHAMKNSSGVTGAAPIWNAFMKTVINDQKRLAVVRGARERYGFETPTTFKRPKDVVDGSVCSLRSLNKISSNCPDFQRELFLSGTKPENDVFVTTDAVVVPLPPPPAPAEGEPAPDPKQPKSQPTALLCAPFEGEFDKVQPVAVLPWPESDQEKPYAIEWATKSGWTAAPPVEGCSSEMVAAALASGSLAGISLEALNAGIFLTDTLGISGTVRTRLQPSTVRVVRLNVQPGSVLTARTVLSGTVRFDPNEAEYFKVELGRGRQPTEWMTLGDTHRDQVAGGPLEVLDAPSLPPDEYIVRLVLVGKDGNFLGEPFVVPVTIARAASGP